MGAFCLAYKMKDIDYIVVGLGLAGMAFSEQLSTNGKSFVVFQGNKPSASRVSGGVYNPVILKRYTLPYKAEEQLDLTHTYYNGLAEKLGSEMVRPLEVLRLFSSHEDQNNWFDGLSKAGLSRFLSPSLRKEGIYGVKAPFHLGEVKETGQVFVAELLDAYANLLKENDKLITENFDHKSVKFDEKWVIYGNYRAKNIVFAEGFGIKENPFFSALPLVGNKGEYLFIKSADLNLKSALKGPFFIIPLKNGTYKVGATFNWKDKDTMPTQAASEDIVEKLKQMLSCDFEVVDQEAGVRPTTGDRRPLLGRHPHFPQLALLNGLGTRGIMAAPYLAELLYEHLETGKSLPEEVHLMRFPKKFKK